jgi:curved DNA-binding protein CbpA
MKINFNDQLGIRKSEDIPQAYNYLDDSIIGYEFYADLESPTTSLEALNHHGERLYNIPENSLPEYGDGNWVPLSSEERFNFPSTKEELKELEFLKKFRKTYESDLSQDQKHVILSALLKEYCNLSSPKLAANWYLWDLMEIPSISSSLSEVLYFEGIKSKQDIKMASDKKLLNITGIGPGRLKQIRAYFSREANNNELSQTRDDFQPKTFHQNSTGEKIKSIEIDISRAQKIYLPKLKYERSTDPIDSIKQDWDKYNSFTRNALLFYNTKRYQQAKDEWMNIYNWYHKDEKYYLALLRTYRKLIDATIKKQMYREALIHLTELFKNCSNYTNSDIINYNIAASHLNKLNQVSKIPLKEPKVVVAPDFFSDSGAIIFLQESKKPRGYKIQNSGGTSILDLKSLSDYLPETLPHIEFDDSNLIFKLFDFIPSIPNNTYRFRESSNQDAFLSSSKELKIHLYNWNLELLGSFDASIYAESHTHLRRIELSSDLSYFLFAIIDKAYILDSNMNLKYAWQIPYKEGFEKRKVEGSTDENTQVIGCLKILELHNKPTKQEIKSAFRKLVIKWHPDRNPNNPEAEERTRQLIQAYEFLSGEDAQRAFDGINKEDYSWVDLSHITKYEEEGLSLEIIFTIGSGEDWIFGAGISDDGSRIYLGCYSGLIYQINPTGKAEKIYFIPKDTFKLKYSDNFYERTNPISYVTEYNDRKYILTRWYLYILKDDKIVNYLKNEIGNFRWFKNGFIHLNKNSIILFDTDGTKKGTLSFKYPIKNVCFKNNILLVVSTTKAFTFKLNYN